MSNLDPVDYASPLARGAALVPDYMALMLQRQLGGLQTQDMASQIAARNVGVEKERAALAEQAAYRQAIGGLLGGGGAVPGGGLIDPNPDRSLEEARGGLITGQPGQGGPLTAGTLPQAAPQITASDRMRLMLRFPEKREAFKAAFESRDKAAQQSDMRTYGGIYSAGRGKDYTTAAKLYRRRIDADKAAGQDVEDDEAVLADLESGDPARQASAVRAIGTTISALVPEKFAETYGKLNPELEARNNSPGDTTLAFDPLTGEARSIFTSPYKPQLVTTTNADGSSTTTEYVPSSGGGGQSSGGGGLGIVAGNNQGAIRDGGFAKSQPGYKGRGRNGFAMFDTPEQGVAAQERLLTKAYIARGYDTPSKIVNRYAPPSENSSASRANYIGHVAARLGIGPNDPVPPGKVAVLAQAMREFETGTWQRQASGGNSGGGGRVVATSAAKRKEPSQTRVIPGKGTFYKIDGRWYDNAEGV